MIGPVLFTHSIWRVSDELRKKRYAAQVQLQQVQSSEAERPQFQLKQIALQSFQAWRVSETLDPTPGQSPAQANDADDLAGTQRRNDAQRARIAAWGECAKQITHAPDASRADGPQDGAAVWRPWLPKQRVKENWQLTCNIYPHAAATAVATVSFVTVAELLRHEQASIRLRIPGLQD